MPKKSSPAELAEYIRPMVERPEVYDCPSDLLLGSIGVLQNMVTSSVYPAANDVRERLLTDIAALEDRVHEWRDGWKEGDDILQVDTDLSVSYGHLEKEVMHYYGPTAEQMWRGMNALHQQYCAQEITAEVLQFKRRLLGMAKMNEVVRGEGNGRSLAGLELRERLSTDPEFSAQKVLAMVSEVIENVAEALKCDDLKADEIEGLNEDIDAAWKELSLAGIRLM